MILTDLITAHKAQLGKTTERFRALNDADYIRHFALAARRLDKKRPRWLMAELTLTAGVADYAAPAGAIGLYDSEWGQTPVRPHPWDDGYVGFPPIVRQIDSATGARWRLSMPPTAAQIAVWGSVLTARYQAAHEISATRVTPLDSDYDLVMLAALIEALRELSAETTTVQLHKGMTGIPNSGMPSYLYEKALLEFATA